LIILIYFLSELTDYGSLFVLAVLCYLIPDLYSIYWLNKCGDWEVYSKQIKPNFRERLIRWGIILVIVIIIILSILSDYG